jgi:glycosyltransferase involved in cell wall biosynthesis
VLEAMSCEVPVITTKVGNMRDYIQDKVNGLFFPRENALYLGIKLNYLKENKVKRLDIAKNGRKTVLKDYNYERTIKQILNVLKQYLK